MVGMLNKSENAPNTRKPSHQAPIQRGSLGEISTPTKKYHCEINLYKSFIFVVHLILCISWVGQTTNL